MTLVWRRTFEDTHHDFAAEEDGQTVGRIYRHQPGGLPDPVWFWTMTAEHRDRRSLGALSGEVPTRAEAIERVRGAWERAKASGGTAKHGSRTETG